ncbi:MAG: hypothetical protein ACTSWX_06405 [Promethearchaeota archaeon]
MMGWDLGYNGYFYILGVIAIFTLIFVFLFLSRRVLSGRGNRIASNGCKNHGCRDKTTPQVQPIKSIQPIQSVESVISVQSIQSAQPNNEMDKNKSFCSHCGFLLNDREIKFCPQCGAPTS